MQSVGGIFASYRDSELAAERLYARGFSADHVTILAPGSHPDVSTIATDEGERSGIGAALGGVVGGAAGAAGGMQVAAAMAAGFSRYRPGDRGGPPRRGARRCDRCCRRHGDGACDGEWASQGRMVGLRGRDAAREHRAHRAAERRVPGGSRPRGLG
jgi:hypothetical protein